MHIIIKNKKLFVNKYKVKCAVGKRGIGTKRREGDLITPRGKFKIKSILYRKDRIFNFKSKIKKLPIQKNMGWCDDPKSKHYNKLIKFPFRYSAERLHRKDNTYDIILVLNYNLNPIKKGKGSAIFIHVAKKNYKSTAGCIAISKRNLNKIIKKINKKTIVSIN
jgi:L,D-peptidoglycan transpeptidase YkuD (ErfK/YbiS/YcfS/YnhG family)